MREGILAAVVTYALWGVLPVYWKSLKTVPAPEILCHRTVWSLIFLLLLLTVRKHGRWLWKAAKNRRTLITFLGSACLLALNWLTYIWAVNTGHVVESSLGYFINPLLSVVLGVLFLREHLRLWQGLAVALATAGVFFLTLRLGVFPWIALILAGTFGFYGLLRKTAPLGSLEGLTLETAMLSLPALIYLVYLEVTGTASFGRGDALTTVLLVATGIVTAFPLLMFAYAARRVTLATVGILQYIAPTLQFLLGVLVYREPFTQTHLVGFAIIWLAVSIYSIEGVREERRRRARMLAIG